MTGLLWLGCQSGTKSSNEAPAEPAAASPAAASGVQEPALSSLEPYARDIENLCFAEERSGALDQPENERVMVVAMWLGRTLTTDEGRSFLAKVSQASPADKVALLDGEAQRLGLPRCPLARAWSGGPKD